MQPGDTITAPASGWGAGHRSLVRLSGPGVPGVLAACFHPAILMPAAPCVTRARFLIRPAEASSRSLPLLPLPLLVLVYPAPRSYTGEHAAELLLPGSPALVERVLATLMAHPGVREASPGEFTARAYLAGKMTLAQAEGVAATIASRNSDELAAARSVLDGSAGARLRGWCDELASLLALVEAGIDFTDQEDVVPIAPPVLLAALARLRSEMDAYLGHAQGDEARTDAPVVVLAGRPNAGKSTLFNALLGRRRAVVSPLEGTTRDLLVEDLDLSDDVPGGPVVRLTDLAGIDDAILPPLPSAIPARIDVDAQHRARVAIAQADVVVLCDPTGRFTSVPPLSDLTRLIRLRTKADLPVHRARPGDPASAQDSPLAVCALDGWNLGPLRRAIADAASQDRRSGGVAVLPRHHRCVATALAAIDRAAASLKGAAGPQPPGAPPPRAIASPELVADSLRAALDELGSLAGRISPDDVIGRIFATFCIGK